MELDKSGVDIDLTSVRHADESFMILNDRLDETSPLDGSAFASEESQSESSDSSYLNIDLDDEIEDEEIDTTESVDLDEQQANLNRELEDVSSGTVMVVFKLRSQMICSQVDAEATEQSHSEQDLCSSIPGMYRILDLISERGTSGLGMIVHDVST